MSKVTLTLPTVGELDTAAEPRVTTALKALEEFLNGAKIESTDNIKAEGITEASLSSALKTKLGGSFVGLAVEEKTVNFEGEAGKLYKVAKACTATLPAATSGRTIGLTNSTAAEAVKVSAKAGKKIVGDYFEGEVAELLAGQHLIVEADGSNWRIMAGEPKREQTYSAEKSYTKAEAEAGVEVSATRPAQVQLTMTLSSPGTVRITVGAVQISEVGETTKFTTSIFVPPGLKWKVQTGSGTVVESHLLL